MTTVAYRDGIMAADSQGTTEHYLEKQNCTKLYKVGKKIVGLSGGSFAGLIFLEYLKGKKTNEDVAFELDVGDDFLALVWEKGRLTLVNRYLVADEPPRQDFWAIGSGGKIALGAMECGASAQEAVRVASLYDLYTSGPVRTISVSEGKKK